MNYKSRLSNLAKKTRYELPMIGIGSLILAPPAALAGGMAGYAISLGNIQVAYAGAALGAVAGVGLAIHSRLYSTIDDGYTV